MMIGNDLTGLCIVAYSLLENNSVVNILSDSFESDVKYSFTYEMCLSYIESDGDDYCIWPLIIIGMVIISCSPFLGTRCDCICPTGYSGKGCEITKRRKG